MKKDFQQTKSQKKSNGESKPENNNDKNSSQPQCYECKGFGHYASKIVKRKLKNKGKVLNVKWDDDSDDKVDDQHLLLLIMIMLNVLLSWLGPTSPLCRVHLIEILSLMRMFQKIFNVPDDEHDLTRKGIDETTEGLN